MSSLPVSISIAGKKNIGIGRLLNTHVFYACDVYKVRQSSGRPDAVFILWYYHVKYSALPYPSHHTL